MEMVLCQKQPKSAVEYYVRLYCLKKLRKEKKGCKLKKKNLISEATISWLKLNAKKKHIITTRFKSRQLKLKKIFAEKLRYVKPISTVILSDTASSIINTINPAESRENTDHILDSQRNNSLIVGNEDISKYADNGCEDLTRVNNTKISNVSRSLVHESEKQESVLPYSQFPVLLLEPTPPTFRTSRDLYDLLNKNTEDTVPWPKLTRKVKGQYERTATKIRRNYIQAYSSFLESLTPIELYNHYKKVTEV